MNNAEPQNNNKVSWWFFLSPSLLILFSFLIYYPTLWYDFIFDDFPTIIEYMHARVVDFRGLFFNNTRWISRLLNQYTFTHWQKNPFGYRIFDVGLHLVIGVLVFFVVYRLFSRITKFLFLKEQAYLLALVTTALYLLHPVQTQTVTYITQMRLEGLAMFFLFAVLTCFVLAVQSTSKVNRYFFYGLSYVFTAFAAGTKEVIVVLPFLLAIVDWFFVAEGDWQSFKSRLLFHGGYFAIIFGLFWSFGHVKPHNIVTMATTPVHNNRGNLLTQTPKEYITLFPFFISQFKVILHYLGIFFWPVNLCFDYDYTLSQSIFGPDVIFPFMLLLSVAGVGLYLWIKNRAHIISFCIAWFFISILPRASIFPGTELVCDYKTFIPSFGVLLFIAFVLVYGAIQLIQYITTAKLLAWSQTHTIALWFVVIALFGGATKLRNNAWSSEAALWLDVIQKTPQKSRGYNNYAVALSEAGKVDEAIKSFERAIELDNNYAEPHVNLASIYHGRGQRDKAYPHYMQALDIGEGHPSLFNNLGMFHLEGGDVAAAEWCFKECLNLCSYYSRALRNLAIIYLGQGRIGEAEPLFERALHGDFVDEDMYFMHGVLCRDLGKFDKAVASLTKIDPGYKDTAGILAFCYFTMRKYQEAAPYMKMLYEKQPQNSMLAYNYALCLLNLGKSGEALPLFDRCRRDSNGNPFAGLHYGRCLFEIGQKDQAKQELTHMVKTIKDAHVKSDVISYMKEVKLA